MDRLEIKAGRPPKEQAEALGDHVVAVADALFIEKGYGATSMATVALRARVGKQTLYRRFPDKATLFREVIRRRIDAMLIAAPDGAPSRDPLGDLKKMARATLDTVLDPDFVQLYRIIIAEALPFPELACAVADNWGSSFADRCIDAVRQAQALGLCKPGDPETLAKCFLWSVTGEAFLKGLAGQAPPQSKADRDAHLEIAWRVFLEGVGTERSAI